jgi:hypothetical protein
MFEGYLFCPWQMFRGYLVCRKPPKSLYCNGLIKGSPARSPSARDRPGTRPQKSVDNNLARVLSSFHVREESVKLTSEEKEILRRIGKRAYRAMVRSVGKKRMTELSIAHGKLGSRPVVYDPCPHYKETRDEEGKINTRHRFLNGGVCKCGARKLTTYKTKAAQ